ncbi:hypothetical protein [Clostridium formicaceticum]|uniref:Uncharacterized protein n=1 Tax=Clostridium formicaceticum TaxID=1497 RepID=A0AAC9WFD9_9CLOT|nr:hypothetical protein [Clostridium formicaceticum]AOY76246.1 hypothetical protein BJL90_10235 [Clostridium formicaceticum]ARE86626.1 hypothetical protein CLFO_09520 [Clostridium formicaceticum]
MLFLRMGPRLLFVRTDAIEAVKNFLLEDLMGKETEFLLGMEEATEDSCLIFLTDIYSTKTAVTDAKTTVLVNEPASICLATMINSHIAHLVEKVDMGPSSIVMRTAGDKQRAIEGILRQYGGKALPLEEAVDEGEMGDTILFLTHKQISRRLLRADMFETPLLLPHPASQIFKKLRCEGILFITQSLQDKKWYELRINIYDAQGKYQEHYNRLNYILTQLEIGMVLEEGWTRDHALMLFSVLAYQIRLFTLYKPEEMKRILLGLEYDARGNRWVDLDLYYRNKKISWVDIDKKKGKRNKIQECLVRRENILEKLSEQEKNHLFYLESKVLE